MADETPNPKKPAAPAPAPTHKGLVAELLTPPTVVEQAKEPRTGPPTVAEHLEASLLECANDRERADVRFFHAGAATMQRWAPDAQITLADYAAGVRAFASVKFNAGTPADAPEKG